MGMNRLNYDKLTKDTVMDSGKEGLEANDFSTTNFVAAAGMTALLGLASGCIDLSKKEVLGSLVKDGDFAGHVDAELKATKVGDSVAFVAGPGDYGAMFMGVGPDGKAHFNIIRNGEIKHFAVGNYEKPDTYEKMLDVTDKIMAGQSTDSVALLKFEGTGRWGTLAYAYINGSEVDLKLVSVFR